MRAVTPHTRTEHPMKNCKSLIVATVLALSAGCQVSHNTATAAGTGRNAVDSMQAAAVRSIQVQARMALHDQANTYVARLLERNRMQLAIARNEGADTRRIRVPLGK